MSDTKIFPVNSVGSPRRASDTQKLSAKAVPTPPPPDTLEDLAAETPATRPGHPELDTLQQTMISLLARIFVLGEAVPTSRLHEASAHLGEAQQILDGLLSHKALIEAALRRLKELTPANSPWQARWEQFKRLFSIPPS